MYEYHRLFQLQLDVKGGSKAHRLDRVGGQNYSQWGVWNLGDASVDSILRRTERKWTVEMDSWQLSRNLE